MSKFVVNKNSWHYRLNVRALKQGKHMLSHEVDSVMQHKSNFCDYWRMTMVNVFDIAIFVTAIIAIICFILLGLYTAAEFFFTAPSVEIQATLIKILFFIFVFAAVFMVGWYFEKQNKKLRQIARGEYKEPKAGLFKTKYMSLKEKICPVVEYE